MTFDTPHIYMFLIILLLVVSGVKIGSMVVATTFFGLPTHTGLSFGILMNTKGIMELIVLYITFDKKVLYTQSYSTMIMMSVVMTTIVTPLSFKVLRSSRRLMIHDKRGTIHRAKPNTEIRMVACIHRTRNVPSIISMLEISYPTKRSPIFVHTVQLKSHESAMLIVNDNQQEYSNKTRQDALMIIKSFESYDMYVAGVSVHPLTIVSPYTTMHEDVCHLAEDKHVALLVLPFHKHHTVDGGMETTNIGIQTFNRNMLDNSLCSVGILVDRGIGGTVSLTDQWIPYHSSIMLLCCSSADRMIEKHWRMLNVLLIIPLLT
ncbi:hypothetical protein ZOSMA_107G00500 [Zostera marina]|uniref:Cation/H+ exchanger domain-containing protein n=1 Tax=Zostera marina TaxID=29655 RepID=A0A0K9Q440_ZOSMR|nr:hypothetical protein ZOSMA_107G00500 [Zostera marina]